ncbi:MAG: hypothetical protein J5517_06970 [Eubacterium sp.]|nr:hypothetical protein [Eubacterium sp.]
MLKRRKKVLSVVLASMLTLSGIVSVPGRAEAAEGDTDYGISSPRIEYNYRDTVTFGSYWQVDTNGDGKADQNDDKQPVVWQILKRYDDGTALVLADKVLAYRSYFDGYMQDNGFLNYRCTWETSTMREWLNDTFYNDAFSADEKTAIYETDVVNNDNPIEIYNGKGGNNTKDKLFLLSLDEVCNSDYGFHGGYYDSDEGRLARFTDYVGRGNIDKTGWCWLRSPGNNQLHGAYIERDGTTRPEGFYVYNEGGVRPALKIDLSSPYVKSGKKVKISIKGVEWDTVTFGTFDTEPITWKVLYVDGDDAFLLSKNSLGDKQLNKTDGPVTWEECTLRTWLNGEFYNGSFNDAEKETIKTTTLINNDHKLLGTDGGNDTEDKVFLLSIEDIIQSKYGFPEYALVKTDSKVLLVPHYTEEVGHTWWLRSPGWEEREFIYVSSSGRVYDDGNAAIYEAAGVRPAIHINLSSTTWTKGDVITSGDPVINVEEPEEETPAEETPAEETPAEETPSGETPGEETAPAPETVPAEETPGEEVAPAPPTVVAPKPPVNNAPPKAENEEVTSDQSEATPAPAEVKDNKTTFSIKNKAKVKKSSKIKIKDKDKIAKITLNGKKIKIKADKKSFTLKLKSYKKILKKKGKWNKLVVTDANGNKTTIKFKTK